MLTQAVQSTCHGACGTTHRWADVTGLWKKGINPLTQWQRKICKPRPELCTQCSLLMCSQLWSAFSVCRDFLIVFPAHSPVCVYSRSRLFQTLSQNKNLSMKPVQCSLRPGVLELKPHCLTFAVKLRKRGANLQSLSVTSSRVQIKIRKLHVTLTRHYLTLHDLPAQYGNLLT